MLRSLIAVSMLAVATSSIAAHERAVANRYDLKDGSTVHVFIDGKMVMEDKLGRPVSMKPGIPMELKDGQRLVMVGDEVARLVVLKAEHRGGP